MNETKLKQLTTLASMNNQDKWPEFSVLWEELSAEMVRDGEAKSLPDAAIILHEECEKARVQP